jgi:hypothetical protein
MPIKMPVYLMNFHLMMLFLLLHEIETPRLVEAGNKKALMSI